ncbi:MAG TPA: hypothetical protein VHW23_44280 [Kofleriaceae bacterium]|nr:hypothetical protein [Kofleriaceae bacterium]
MLSSAGSHAEPVRDAAAWLTAAYQRKASGDLGGAVEAFRAARAAGADPQRIALELAYAELALGDTAAARDDLAAAARGPDARLAGQARDQLAALPGAWWADLYIEAFGWHRARGAAASTDLVPTVRVRGLRRLATAPEVNLYVFAQATRDTSSTGAGVGAAPRIYADDRALAGGGVLVRLWHRRVGLFAQLGPAVPLIEGGGQLALDIRGGGYLATETAACARRGRATCAELYAEAVYTIRFDHDIQTLARGRLSRSYLDTGPVSWQLFVEGRGAASRNGDYYNNFVDLGAGPRWRLRTAIPVDVLLGGHVGGYLGRANRDPAPTSLGYADLRALATTYVEF